MRLPTGWTFIFAAIVWTIGGLFIERENIPRDRSPGPFTEKPQTGVPGFIRSIKEAQLEKVLPDISPSDPEILVQWGTSGGNATGTAFPVSTGGFWLTARHVVDDCARVGIFSSQTAQKGFWVQKVYVHPNADIAVLQTSRTPPAIAIRPVSKKLIVGQTGYHFGFPQGEPGDLLSELIGRRKLRKIGRQSFVEPAIAWAVKLQAPRLGAFGGISGGPVLDRKGQVVGVTVAGNIRRGRVIASPPKTINEFLRFISIKPDGTPSANVSRKTLNEDAFSFHGDNLRKNLSVAKVFCKGRV